MQHRLFGLKMQGERSLAFLLVPAALNLVCLATIHSPLLLPPDHRSRGDMFMLLLATVLALGAIAAWRWKQCHAELIVSVDGLCFRSKRPRQVGVTELCWDHID